MASEERGNSSDFFKNLIYIQEYIIAHSKSAISRKSLSQFIEQNKEFYTVTRIINVVKVLFREETLSR